jgi:hypothetical protein
MSKSDGITRSRSKVESYKGFSIIKVYAVHHWWNSFSKCYEMSNQYITKREVYYEFCKEGDENKPAQAYNVSEKNIEAIKERIDKFIEDDSLYFTEAERHKYVYKPNHDCDWGYGYESLMKIMRQHKKATKRMKVLLEDRLEDANFHSACSYLCKCDYEGFEKWAADNCQFPEKFEIYTHTKRKRIPDPKNLTEAISKAISKVLEEAGVIDTEVSVNFIEDW